ncbi:hypothetical protein E6W26_28950 [Pseudomonas aeruginosa]|uniref:hypothetical protein n=1 Tax=Pseudomonas aeruginosa TaxID=287 RepID=UPI00109DA46C|nr:hypothetical protein [Pseudomonas aeruginosa]EKV1241298.1 hypothetical protein [Pseudomonas aeruginosa]EKV8586207.1 hypothetical protein [Pseudomonas aeruginosa]ELN5407425.1 hypothetical protein [Pseudomonas aeruginosa]ELP1438616.1 hypothetical protein [Pseudomonas aeruginosa]THB16428.1 hypothetical protein E6W26_28950 [Pseudomonas aeruginosa]
MNDKTINPKGVKQRKPRTRVKNSVRYLVEMKNILKTGIGQVVDECLQVSTLPYTAEGNVFANDLPRNMIFITTNTNLKRYLFKDAVPSRNYQTGTFAQRRMTNLVQAFVDDLFETKDADVNNLTAEQVEIGLKNFSQTKEKYLTLAFRERFKHNKTRE